MLVVSSNEFRDNLKKYLDLALNDEEVFLKRGKDTFIITPVLPKVSYNPEIVNRVKDSEAMEYEEPSKEQILQELKEAVKELILVGQGKLKARPVKELLDEL